MFRDPLYRQIRRGLRELKDGNTFEACANDLLRKFYPSLAPREGGDDAGLDGLIAHEDKSSIQLICTTGEDVLGNLSGRWSKDKPEQVVKILTSVESQSRSAGVSCMSWDRHVCCRIADATSEAEAWIAALFNHDASPQLIEPFLDKLAASAPEPAKPWVAKALGAPGLQALGVLMVLKHYSPESPLWAAASPFFKSHSFQIGICSRRNIKVESARTLLRSPEASVASAVAVGLWNDSSTPTIPDEILEDWKNVMVNHDDDNDHVLEGVFKEYPDVAFRWIASRLDGIRDGTRSFYFGGKYDRAMPTAIQTFTQEQRRELIDKMPRSSAVAELVRSLIGRDMELFSHLLAREELEGVRLDPLRLDCDFGPQGENAVPEIDAGWERMAIAAMERGFSPEDIFSASQAGGFGWSGPMSSMFAARAAPFEKLLRHRDIRLRQVGKIGFEHYSALRDEHLAHEKRAAIRGERG